MKRYSHTRLRAAVAVLLALAAGAAMSEDLHAQSSTSRLMPREHVRAFYSGHSLSEGVPEVVEQIAQLDIASISRCR
jgi:hypothetical protein